MRIEQLTYLLAVKESGSITKASEEAFISHQALSKSIRSLEKELGVALLKRSSQGVTLTDAGNRVCQTALTILKETDLLKEDLTVYQPTPPNKFSGDVAIYANARYITNSFLNLIKKLQLNNAQLNIALYNKNTEYILKEVTYSPSVLGLITSSLPFPAELENILKNKDLSYTVLDCQKLYACVHQKHPLAQQPLITLADSYAYPSVSFNFNLPPIVNIVEESTYVIDGFEQQRNLIKQGHCFGRYTQKEFQHFFPKSFKLVPLEDAPELLFIMVHHANFTPAVKTLQQALLSKGNFPL